MLDLLEPATRPPAAQVRRGDAGHGIRIEGLRRRQGASLEAVQPLVRRLVGRYAPVSIWLFGSRARGDARPDSDWHIMVVVPDDAPEGDLDLGEAWRVRSGTGIAADIVPVRHGEFMEDLAVPDALPYEVAMDGVLLHER